MKNLTKQQIMTIGLTALLSACGGSGDEVKLEIVSPADHQMYAVSNQTQTTKDFTVTLGNSNISGVGASPGYAVSLTGIASPFSIMNNNCNDLSVGQQCSFSIRYTPASDNDYNIAQALNVTLSSKYR